MNHNVDVPSDVVANGQKRENNCKRLHRVNTESQLKNEPELVVDINRGSSVSQGGCFCRNAVTEVLVEYGVLIAMYKSSLGLLAKSANMFEEKK